MSRFFVAICRMGFPVMIALDCGIVLIRGTGRESESAFLVQKY